MSTEVAEELDTKETDVTQESEDILDMSDDEVDAYIRSLEEAEKNAEQTDDSEEEEEDSGEPESDEAEGEVEDGGEAEEPKQEDSSKKDIYKSTSIEKQSEQDISDTDKAIKEVKDNEASVNYQEEYKKLTAPFKANGREMQIDNVDDARTLMQMGANYNKKMAALKPNLKIIKMLENNQLLDESKLSYLIDLSKNNPEAISKLIKDSGIDPLDIDTDNAKNYVPDAYTVNDKEVELDAILDEIRDSSAFNTTASIIGNKWDESSKQVLVDNPSIIKIINDHVETGIYDKIAKVVESERTLGRLNGLSDIEAYKYVGDAINAKGGFNDLTNGTSSGTNNVKATNRVDSSLKDKKRAASSTKGAAKKSSKIDPDFNPLALSDEEIAKVGIDKFI